MFTSDTKFITIYNQTLSVNEQRIFRLFLDYVKNYQDKNELQLVYRGEQKIRLQKRLRKSYGTTDFFKRIFFIGEKAKMYYEKANQTLNYLTSINDISIETFQFIFEEFNKIFSQSPNRKVKKWLKDNQDNLIFHNFFLSPENINFFIKINFLQDQDYLKLKIRDYYLYLLHNYESYKESFFVSTSTDISNAKTFALGKQKDRTEGVIFYYLLPSPYHEYSYSIDHPETQEISEHCQYLKLPYYSSIFYPREKEVAVKGCLFPHFILGIYELEQESFVVNPNIFNQPHDHPNIFNQSEDYLKTAACKGLRINQRDFDQFLLGTEYHGYVSKAKNIYKDHRIK